MIIRHLINFVETTDSKTFQIDIPYLILAMLEIYYESELNQHHRWFVTSHDLPAAICNFLRTRDCFKDTFPRPEVDIRFSAKKVLNPYGVQIIGDVKWYAPVVNLANFVAASAIGSEYRLLPQYIEPILDGEYTSYAVEPVYCVASNTLPLAWDQSVQGFRGIVPNITSGFEALKPLLRLGYTSHSSIMRAAYINLTVVATKFFPGNVRFERVSRFKIQLNITPKMQGPRISTTLKNHSGSQDADSRRFPEDSRLVQITHPYDKHHPCSTDCVYPQNKPGRRNNKHNQLVSTHQNIQVNTLLGLHTPPRPLGDRTSSWLPSYTNTPDSKRPHTRSTDASLAGMRNASPLELLPPLRSSARVSRNSTRRVKSRPCSLSSGANFTDEILSTDGRRKQRRLRPCDDEEASFFPTLLLPSPSDHADESHFRTEDLCFPSHSWDLPSDLKSRASHKKTLRPPSPSWETPSNANPDQPPQIPSRRWGSRYKRLKASQSATVCPPSSSSTDATITANDYKEHKRADSAMGGCIGESLYGLDGEDEFDWAEQFLLFKAAATTPNLLESYGIFSPPNYQHGNDRTHDRSLATDESTYTATDDGKIDKSHRPVPVYPILHEDGKFDRNYFRNLPSGFQNETFGEDRVFTVRQVPERTNPGTTGRANMLPESYRKLEVVFESPTVEPSHNLCKNAPEFTTAQSPSKSPSVTQQEIQANYEAFLRDKARVLAEEHVDDSEAKEFEAMFMGVDEQEEQAWDDESAYDEP